jgi:acyl-CoA synthetase (AMP-forming)/AMP-acid ligase II
LSNPKVDRNALKDWINSNVSAKFQRVSDVIVLQEFPRNAAGKTLKRAIKEEYLRTAPPAR